MTDLDLMGGEPLKSSRVESSRVKSSQALDLDLMGGGDKGDAERHDSEGDLEGGSGTEGCLMGAAAGSRRTARPEDDNALAAVWPSEAQDALASAEDETSAEDEASTEDETSAEDETSLVASSDEALGSSAGDETDDDLSDVLRREFVRQTIVGIVTSTRAALASNGASNSSQVDGASNSSHVDGASTVSYTPPPYTPSACKQLPAASFRKGTLAAGDGVEVVGWEVEKSKAAELEAGLATGSRCPEVLALRHFHEVARLELSSGVTFCDFAPQVWQALRQSVYKVSSPAYLHSLMGS